MSKNRLNEGGFFGPGEDDTPETIESVKKNRGRLLAIPGFLALVAGLTLPSNNANAGDTDRPWRKTENVGSSRPAQELDRNVELIGQGEMDRLVNCHNIISAHYINPLFLELIYRVNKRNNAVEINEDVLSALRLAIQFPYELSYKQDSEGNIIVSKRKIGEDGNIPDGFKIKIYMGIDGRNGHITEIVSEVEEGKMERVLNITSTKNMDWMNPKNIAAGVAHHYRVINSSLGGYSEEEKRALPKPLKQAFVLQNIIVPAQIRDVMRLRDFNEFGNQNLGQGFNDFNSGVASQSTAFRAPNVSSFEEYVTDDNIWMEELNALTDSDHLGSYRIANLDPEPDTFLDVSLDGYVLDTSGNNDVKENTRRDGRKHQLNGMYYVTDNDSDNYPEHLLKRRYYENHPEARNNK
ncbi:hypothetical protein JW758_06260 [Candidatus Peregrinibacteria bacterium]|nr:hypothetical protein [Candidatus Peregrinibacteria bacterium]